MMFQKTSNAKDGGVAHDFARGTEVVYYETDGVQYALIEWETLRCVADILVCHFGVMFSEFHEEFVHGFGTVDLLVCCIFGPGCVSQIGVECSGDVDVRVDIHQRVVESEEH
ncbi:hypothetical protein L916_20089, partial [Phytophthora nicotianae]